jgi:hypothetical protein
MRHSLLLLFFVPILSFGQTNLFDSIGSKWYTTSGYYMTGPETQINSMDYRELMRCNQPDYMNLESVGAIRYETASSKVFFVPVLLNGMPNTQEFLLYDFDVNLQDTVRVFNDLTNFQQDVRVKVNSLSTITIGSEQYQKVGVEGIDQSSQYTESWQFGTGSSFGLLNPGLSGVVIFDIDYPVLICSELDTIYYHNPAFQSCVNDLSVSNSLADQLTVYLENKQVVVEGLEIAQVQQATFVTLSGSSFPIEQLIASEKSGFRFDIPEQASGLVIIQILTTKNEWISAKVFVTD